MTDRVMRLFQMNQSACILGDHGVTHSCCLVCSSSVSYIWIKYKAAEKSNDISQKKGVKLTLGAIQINKCHKKNTTLHFYSAFTNILWTLTDTNKGRTVNI